MNERTDTLFVSNNGAEDGFPVGGPAVNAAVSVVNAATCNAKNTSGCNRRAPVAFVGSHPGQAAIDQATNTAFVPTNQNAVTILNGATCDTTDRAGCGQTTPSTPAGLNATSAAINQATHTVYVGDGLFGGDTPSLGIAVINAAACNTKITSGCGTNPPMVPMNFNPFALAVNPATNTIYATNELSLTGRPGNTVSVIDGATCDAANTTGCAKTPATVTVGKAPAGVAVDQATDTVYAANSGSGTVSVINGATCNGTVTSGCGQKPRQVHVKTPPFSVAVDQATDTVYVLNPGSPGTVSVINGSTCNAKVTSGCGQAPPTVTVGDIFPSRAPLGEEGLAVDQATDTIYVVNTGDDTVSVINGATCNGTVTSGCGQKPAHVAVGRMAQGYVAVDQATGQVYVSNLIDDTVSVINGADCNGHVTSGCARTPPTVLAGPGPDGVAVDQATDTVYAAGQGGADVSFFSFVRPARPTQVTASTHAGQVKLRWRPPYDGGLPIIYQIIPFPACPACRGLITPSTSGQPFTTITGLKPGHRYTFKVHAVDAAGTGHPSAPSNPVMP